MFCHMRKTAVLFAILYSGVLVFSGKAFCSKFPGEISQVKGVVEVQKAGRTLWFKAIDGLPLQLKDKIRTQANSSCNLEIDDGSLIFVDQNTQASVEYIEITQEKHSTTLGLWVGKLLNNIKKSPSTKMRIKCPTAVISVRGTEFAVEVSSQSADVGVFDGEVAVSSASEKSGEDIELSSSTAQNDVTPLVSVKPDEQTTIAMGEPPKPPSKLSLLMQKNKDRLNELKGRVQELREKLKRTKPEYLDKVRQEALDRVMGIKDQRDQLREKIGSQRDELRQGR